MITAKHLIRYLFHVAIATVVVPLIPIAAGFAVMAVFPSDAVGRWTDAVVGPPFSILPITFGFLLGLAINKQEKDFSAAFAWLPAFVWLVHQLTFGDYSLAHTSWRDAFSNLFGFDCGGSDCIYEVLVTMPFFTSVAYSAGAIIGRRMRPAAKPEAA